MLGPNEQTRRVLAPHLAKQVDRQQIIITMMRLVRGNLKKGIIQHRYLKYWGGVDLCVSVCVGPFHWHGIRI